MRRQQQQHSSITVIEHHQDSVESLAAEGVDG